MNFTVLHCTVLYCTVLECALLFTMYSSLHKSHVIWLLYKHSSLFYSVTCNNKWFINIIKMLFSLFNHANTKRDERIKKKIWALSVKI